MVYSFAYVVGDGTFCFLIRAKNVLEQEFSVQAHFFQTQKGRLSFIEFTDGSAFNEEIV